MGRTPKPHAPNPKPYREIVRCPLFNENAKTLTGEPSAPYPVEPPAQTHRWNLRSTLYRDPHRLSRTAPRITGRTIVPPYGDPTGAPRITINEGQTCINAGVRLASVAGLNCNVFLHMQLLICPAFFGWVQSASVSGV